MRSTRLLVLVVMLTLSHAAWAASGNKLVRVLKSGHVAFGSFVLEKSPAAATTLGANKDLDFLFYDLEHGDFDIPTLQAFLEALRTSDDPHAVLVRIPPIHDDPAKARERIEALIEAGVDGVALPHIMNAEEARGAVAWIEAVTDRMWPANSDGDFVSFMMIEDRESVDHVGEIVSTERVSIFSPGPGSLRGAYGGDMAAVEDAVAKVLAACKASSVPCANTASDSDVVSKVERGFRVLIVRGDALQAGRHAAGR